MNKIPTPTMKDFLYDEFMEPLGITPYRLAHEIHVPYSRIREIILGKRKVTVDTSLRLAKFFGVSDKFFLNLQNDIDLRNGKEILSEDLNSINELRLIA